MSRCVACGSPRLAAGECLECGARVGAQPPVDFRAAGLTLTEVAEEEPVEVAHGYVEMLGHQAPGTEAARLPASALRVVTGARPCPACGEALPDPPGAFCDGCGQKLPRLRRAAPVVSAAPRRCTSCGTVANPGRLRCVACGGRLPSDEA
jgi:hypothetical protein